MRNVYVILYDTLSGKMPEVFENGMEAMNYLTSGNGPCDYIAIPSDPDSVRGADCLNTWAVRRHGHTGQIATLIETRLN